MFSRVRTGGDLVSMQSQAVRGGLERGCSSRSSRSAEDTVRRPGGMTSVVAPKVSTSARHAVGRVDVLPLPPAVGLPTAFSAPSGTACGLDLQQ